MATKGWYWKMKGGREEREE